MVSALPLAAARFSKLWIQFLNHLLDGDWRKNFRYIYILFVSGFQSLLCDIHDFTHVAASNSNR